MASADIHTILLVDDEILIREGLANHLEECGFQVIRAGSGDAALAILEEPDCAVDLVFTDVRMPGHLDGFGLLKWINANRPELPVIVASGNIVKEAAVEDLCGAPSVGKPFDYEKVTHQIRGLIARRRPRA